MAGEQTTPTGSAINVPAISGIDEPCFEQLHGSIGISNVNLLAAS